MIAPDITVKSAPSALLSCPHNKFFYKNETIQTCNNIGKSKKITMENISNIYYCKAFIKNATKSYIFVYRPAL